MGSRTNSGGTRSPARFSPPRGRGGARGVASHRGQLAGPPEGVGVAGAGPGAADLACRLCRLRTGAGTWGVGQPPPWGRRLAPPGGASTVSTNGGCPVQGRGAPLAGVSRYSPPAMFPRLPRVNRLQIGRPPSRGRRATWRRRSGGGRASTAEGRVREMKSPTDASSICEARISPVATASGDFL